MDSDRAILRVIDQLAVLHETFRNETPMLTGPSILPLSGKAPKQLVVFLHGYGADGENLIDIARSWQDSLPDAEFIAPDAPNPCEINPLGRQWFGLVDFSPFNVRAGLDNVRPRVTRYLKGLLAERQLSLSNLVLVGFSQGTMLALDLMFSLPHLQGVIGYSGAFYPPIAETLQPPYPEVLLVHGAMDTIVPYTALGEAERQLKLFGVTPSTHTCPGLGHSINHTGITLGGQFLERVFNNSDAVIYMS